MRKQFLFAACTLFAASALLMTSCQQAEEPIANDPTDQAGPMTRAATLGNFYRVVYVEVNDVNPLNAGEYLLSDGTPFFTHVILFASNIRGDASGNVHNYNNPNNAAILANPSTYIAPLQAKGIKVIMGNLGDHTGAGFANLTAAQIGTYTDDLVAYDNIVDGYDFDDEWAEYGTRGYPYANSTSYSNMIIALYFFVYSRQKDSLKNCLPSAFRSIYFHIFSNWPSLEQILIHHSCSGLPFHAS